MCTYDIDVHIFFLDFVLFWIKLFRLPISHVISNGCHFTLMSMGEEGEQKNSYVFLVNELFKNCLSQMQLMEAVYRWLQFQQGVKATLKNLLHYICFFLHGFFLSSKWCNSSTVGSGCSSGAKLNLTLQLSTFMYLMQLFWSSQFENFEEHKNYQEGYWKMSSRPCPQSLTQQAWNGALECAFLSGSWVMLSWDPCFKR